MRLLCIADVHSNIENVRKLRDKLLHNIPDLIVIAGDFTNEGSKSIAEEIIDVLSFAKILAVPGNMDSKEIEDLLEKKGINLHKKKVSFGGYTFIGIGGGKPLNTFYRFNIGELEAEKYLKKLFEEDRNVVLVSHTPPYGNEIDLAHSGVYLGLRALNKIIEEEKPLLCICGHVHEAKGIIKIGNTPCVNVGSLKEGCATIVELGNDIEIKFIEV